MAFINTSIQSVSGVAAKIAVHLKRLGIENVGDLLYHFPVGYEDRRVITPVRAVRGGDSVALKVRLELLQSRRSHKRKMVICEAVGADETGTIRIVWFGNPFVIKTLKVGDEIYVYGNVYADNYGVQMRSPEYEKVKEQSVHVGYLVPRYRLTRGVSHKQLRFFVHKVLDQIDIDEWLPDDILRRNGLMNIEDALRAIHVPRDGKQLRMALRRLKFDELFELQMRSSLTKERMHIQKSYSVAFEEEKIRRFVKQLPFRLTDDQKKSAWQVFLDMQKEHPMNRLLQGDVGSGKTMVAILGLYQVVRAGYTGMLMVPTDILAQQHYETLCGFFKKTDVVVGLSTRTTRKISIEDGEFTKKQFAKKARLIDVWVGTHALLFDDYEIERLGLVVVDEQHRFGVRQRAAIKDRTKSDVMPHFLSMTATPIPRSAALVLYGELDVSVIREKPAGRKPIITKLVSDRGRAQAYSFIANQLDRDRQVFVVCPLIEDSDEMDVASVESVFERLRSSVFADRSVEMLHGKMKQKEKDNIMERMVAGEIDVLISTSVIEVGVDVPNASVMVIEGGERFGLAQLHQFRGRVGRSSHQSYCFVFPTHVYGSAIERLRIFEREQDGFALAQYDLQMRGPGDMYGTIQSGFPDLRLATLKDVDEVGMAQREARYVFDVDSDRVRYPDMWKRMDAKFGDVHLE